MIEELTKKRERVIEITTKALKALAEKKRLKIIDLLSAGELCVCELTDNLGLSQPNISHHLRILKEAGLIIGNKRGKWVYYELNQEKLEQLQKNFDFIISEQPNRTDIIESENC